MSHAPDPAISRRQFMQFAGGTVATCALPTFLAGCGGADDASAAGRVTRTLHFELATGGFLAADETYELHVGGKAYTLTRHDDASRARHGKTASPVSHFATDIDLPANRAIHISVTQRSDRAGHVRAAHGASLDHAFALSAVYVPRTLRKAAASNRALAVRAGPLDATDADAVDFNLDTNDNDEITPAHVAAAIIFHHGNLLTRNADQAAIVLAHIQEAPGLGDLIARIKSFGPHGWYKMVPVLGDNQVPITRSDQSALNQYVVQDSVMQAAQLPLRSTLNAVHNDPALKDLFYSSTVHDALPGDAAVDTASARAHRLDAVTDDGVIYRLARDGLQPGLSTTIDAVEDGIVTLRFSSRYLRYLGVYIEFLDADNQPVAPDAWSHRDVFLSVGAPHENATRKFLCLLSPPSTFLGAPIFAQESTVSFRFPANASGARIMAGGLGCGGRREPDAEVVGVALTSALNLGLPAVLLGMDASEEEEVEPFKPDAGTAFAIVHFFLSIWAQQDHSASGIAKSSATFLGDILFKNALQAVLNYVLEEEAAEAANDAIPFAGWMMNAVAITATWAELSQSSAEVTASPWIIENRLTVLHDIHVRITRDAKDFEFPATATHHVVRLTFSHADTVEITTQLPGTTVSDPQTVVFKNVPSGGTVSVSVTFYSNTDWVAGFVNKTGIANRNDAGQPNQTIELQLVENLVPLSSATLYSHKEKLVRSGSGFAWLASSAPSATRMALSFQPQAGSLASLAGVSVNQTLGRLSYAWQGHSGSLANCASGATGFIGYSHRTIGLGSNPNTGIKFDGCYGSAPTRLENALFTDAAGVGPNLMLEPIDGDGYSVRYVPLDTAPGYASGNVNGVANVLGVFRVRPDVVRRLSDEVLVGISLATKKLFHLRLSPTPTTVDLAPEATLLCGPAQTAASVLDNPNLLMDVVTLAIGLNDSVIVLEAASADTGTGSLRAFNANGQPIRYFGSGTDATGQHRVSLRVPSGPVTYLDMHIEAKGYAYVLCYEGAGSATSDYRLDIYNPDGSYLASTTGVNAAAFSLDAWRNVYTLNYESLTGPGGDTEPSVSQWIPSTPQG